MHRKLQDLHPDLKIWHQQTQPDDKFHACVFEFTSGRCWDVVQWMSKARYDNNWILVCCYNTNWGLANTPMHCVVNNMGIYWFNHIDEMFQYVNEMLVKE